MTSANISEWSEYSQPGAPPSNPFASQPAPRRPPRKKAKHHRRRHVPVGPAGVWFQQQQTGIPPRPQHVQEGDEKDEEEVGIEFTQGLLTKVNRPAGGVAFYSPAWISMQYRLKFVTPSLPAHLTQTERYTACRPHVPGNFYMIPEILAGQADWKFPSDKRMLVLVHAIESITDHLWVAELTDETGAKISAWIQPTLVQQEQQQQVPKYLRPGIVWMLSNVTLLLVSQETDEEEDLPTHSRMLLVGEENIQEAWSPTSGEDDISDEDYIQWMEKRNALTVSVNQDTAIEEHDLLEQPPTTILATENTSTILDNNRPIQDVQPQSQTAALSAPPVNSSASVEERHVPTSTQVVPIRENQRPEHTHDAPKTCDSSEKTNQSLDKHTPPRVSFAQFAVAAADFSDFCSPESVAASSRVPLPSGGDSSFPNQSIQCPTQAPVTQKSTGSSNAAQNAIDIQQFSAQSRKEETQVAAPEQNPILSPPDASQLTRRVNETPARHHPRKRSSSSQKKARKGNSSKKNRKQPTLWSNASIMMGDLDDDEDEDPVAAQSSKRINTGSSLDSSRGAPPMSLFQASAFAEMAMEDFDDDEDD